MSAVPPDVTLNVRSLGFSTQTIRAAATFDQKFSVCRVSHTLPEVEVAALDFNIFVMKRSVGSSHRHRGGRSQSASLTPGKLGLVPYGDYGRWTFECGAGISQDTLHIYLPPDYLNALSEQAGGTARVELCDRLQMDDPALQMLALEVDQAFDRGPIGRLYMDGLVTAISAGLLERHVSGKPFAVARGGLAPWQLRRACEAMEAQIDGDVGLEDLAAIAGCTPAHFSRAFKVSTGVAPFAWLQNRRMERAKELLAVSSLSLAEIALSVGFSAQPQFTTAFRRLTGSTPGQWRRQRLV